MTTLDEWIEEFPYCQNLYFLKAKKHQIHDKLKDLSVFHKAWTYSTDMVVLYERLVNSEVERTKYVNEFKSKTHLGRVGEQVTFADDKVAERDEKKEKKKEKAIRGKEKKLIKKLKRKRKEKAGFPSTNRKAEGRREAVCPYDSPFALDEGE